VCTNQFQADVPDVATNNTIRVSFQGEAVTLSVYYEALCPDSMWFVKYQLYPTWLLLTGQYLAIDFVPYGKATVSELSLGPS